MWFFLLHAGAVLGFTALGVVISRRRRRVWLSAAFVVTGLAVLQAFLRWRPEVLATVVSWIDYPLVQRWHVPAGLFGLAVLIPQLPRRSTRRVVAVALAVIAVYGVWSAGATFLVSFSDLTGKPNSNGFCAQTSTYSCGPAAMSTWLAHLDVDSTERELARLSVTQQHGGVTALGMWRAARLKLRGEPYAVSLRRMSWNDLRSLDKPCLVVVRYSLLVDHFVTVLEVDGDRVTLADPLVGGAGVWTRDEFESRWRRLVIVAEPV